MRRTLDQGALDIEKLMVDPIQRRPGMRAAVTIGKKFTIAQHHEAADGAAIEFDRKSVGTRIR